MRPTRTVLPLFACLLLAACASTGIRSPLASWVPSPNYNARSPVIIVLHHTDQHSVQESLDTLRSANSGGKVSAHYLIAEDGHGITLVNIGVGPSNAKNITDHLAVLRPHCWLMIGHCGGLRQSQTIGDYVLAHAYMRRDGILDRVLPTNIPIPALAEIQRVKSYSFLVWRDGAVEVEHYASGFATGRDLVER